MVYRGKPSAGCENCRKAKKRCGLEQPACSRCVKLKKICAGYRDVTQLQIQDESAAVIEKAKRRAAGLPTDHERAPTGVLTPADSPASSSGSSSDSSIELQIRSRRGSPDDLWMAEEQQYDSGEFDFGSQGSGWSMTLKPHPDEVAVNYFFRYFTDKGHWAFLKNYAFSPKSNPMLNMAIRACGMAALDNVQPVPQGREWSRALYGESLTLLNAALKDPAKCTTNESLIAVAMLSYFENLTCDSRQSIQSWKAHMNGAAQLLRLRGKQQFKNPVGRALFRETRSQIMIHCMWDDMKPPDFLLDWQKDLEERSDDLDFIRPADTLIATCFRFAHLRAQLRQREITNEQGLAEAANLELQMIDWASQTLIGNKSWHYHEVEVDDSPNVWNGTIHVYSLNSPALTVWQTYRSIRIMLTRTQEMLVRRCDLDIKERQSQIAYFKSVRRQMADEICTALPGSLGHAGPAFNNPCTLISAYSTIWPLFFAGTVALERIGAFWSQSPSTSLANAQASWILSRMDYISTEVGLRWADGVAATLRGDFRIHQDLLPDQDELDADQSNMLALQATTAREMPEWIKRIEESGRGPRALIEPENPLTNSLKQRHTKWLSRYHQGPLADTDRLYGGHVQCRCAFSEPCLVHEYTEPEAYRLQYPPSDPATPNVWEQLLVSQNEQQQKKQQRRDPEVEQDGLYCACDAQGYKCPFHAARFLAAGKLPTPPPEEGYEWSQADSWGIQDWDVGDVP